MAPVFTLAQGTQQGADNSLLPEINPQDIEIRSEFRARFPGLRRQPILGFNPKPRVFQIDPNRTPFMETRDEAVADISITQLGRPEPPSRAKLPIPERINVYTRAGFGSYFTPEINGYAFYQPNEESMLTGDINYRSSNGHLDNQQSSFRYLDINAEYTRLLDNDLKLMAGGSGLSDFNDLYKLDNVNIQENLIGETADKTYNGFGAWVSLQKNKNTLSGWNAVLGGNIFSIDMDTGNFTTANELNEQTVSGSFSYYWPGDRLYETFDVRANIDIGNYESPAFNNQQWVDASASLEYERLLNFTTRISGRGGIQYVSDPFSQKFYLVPELEVKHNFSNSLSMQANAFARPQMQTIREHHQYNRFLNAQTQLQHSYEAGVQGEVNLQFFSGNRIFGGLGYKHVRDYAYYNRQVLPTAATDSLGFYGVSYANANIFEIYAGISQQLVPEKFWADFKLNIRTPNLSGTGNTIPYEEKLSTEASLSYKPVRDFTITGSAEYIGARRAPASNKELNAFVLANAHTEYQFNETFGVYVKLLNILGQEYEIWDGYQERPFQVFGGLTIKF